MVKRTERSTKKPIIPNKNEYVDRLRGNHKEVCKKLFTLPPFEVIKGRKMTIPQCVEWRDSQIFWRCFALRFTYFLVKRQGFDLPDPLEHSNFTDVGRKQIDATSRLFLAEFDLLTEGWGLIKSAARSEGRNFAFEHPTEAFWDICRYRAEMDGQWLFPEEVIENKLREFRHSFREESSFFRDRLDSYRTKERLNRYRLSEDWSQFAIYGIWDYRDSTEDLKEAWRGFLKAHKKYISMYCNPKKFFEDKYVSINPRMFTPEGRICIKNNGRWIEAKILNGQIVFS